MFCLAILTAVAFFLEYHQNKKLNEAQFVIELNSLGHERDENRKKTEKQSTEKSGK